MQYLFYPFITLVVLITLAHFMLYKIKYLQNEFNWKRIDYFWLGFAALGLIGATGEVRRISAEREIEFNKMKYENEMKSFNAFIKDDINYLYNSSQNFRVQATSEELKQALIWENSANILKQIDSLILADTSNINLKDMENLLLKFCKSDDVIIEQICTKRKRLFSDVVNAKNNYESNVEDKKLNSLEILLVFISPYLIALALSLRITKTTAEIKFKG